jgi:oxaloacetate decarboxylase (Na+ extruding) subunit gamma
MPPNLLEQGLQLMLVGMGTVFTFLTLLVLAMSLMAAIIQRLTPAAANDEVSSEEIAAISAAIAEHRKAP